MGGAVGGIAGGILGGMGGNSRESGSKMTSINRTDTTSPWGPQIPYLLELFKRAQGSLDQAPEGHGLNMDAANQLRRTMGGDYLFGNPESQKAVDAITKDSTNRAMGGIDSKFASSGRYGSGLHKSALGQQIADTSSAAMAKNYAAERENQIRATQLAPGVADSMDWKQKRLLDFARMIGGNYGNTTTTNGIGKETEQESRNPWAGILGGAGVGARAGRSLFGGGK